jgi:hypothetical protein
MHGNVMQYFTAYQIEKMNSKNFVVCLEKATALIQDEF